MEITVRVKTDTETETLYRKTSQQRRHYGSGCMVKLAFRVEECCIGGDLAPRLGGTEKNSRPIFSNDPFFIDSILSVFCLSLLSEI